MATKICGLNEWSQKLPRGNRLVLVSFTYKDLMISVDSPFLLLAGGCQIFMKAGVLTADKIRRFGVSWIKTNTRGMTAPRHISGPCFISEDGYGTTPISRLAWIAERLNVDLSECIIEYDEDSFVAMNDAHARETANAHLIEWKDGSSMPSDAVQVEFSDIESVSVSELYPYKLVIGNDQYEVEGWTGCAVTFISYLYCNYPNGAWKLFRICKSDWPHQKFIDEVNGEIDIRFIDDLVSSEKVVEILIDLAEKIEFDKYSISMVCTFIKDTSREMSTLDELDENYDVKPGNDGVVGIAPVLPGKDKPVESIFIGEDVDDNRENKDEEAPVGRHFRPRIKIW